MLAYNDTAIRSERQRPADLAARLDCRELARSYMGEPRRKAGRCNLYFAPDRQETAPSFAVYANGVHDFGSGEHYDVFGLIARFERLSFSQALDRAAELAGGALPARLQPRPQRATKAAPDKRWRALADAQIEAGQRALKGDPLAYLHGRGLADETIRRARLGYAPTFTYRDGAGELQHGPAVVIPWPDQPVIRYRLLKPADGDKYRCMTGSQVSGALYVANELQAGRPVLFTEGEFDALIALQALGERVSIVTLGSATSRLSDDWRARIEAVGAPVLLALDTDNAGNTGARALLDLFPTARRVRLPAGKDITEFVVKHGGDLAALIDAALADAPPCADVPDGVRAVMLVCKLDAVLVTLQAWRASIRAGQLKAGERVTPKTLADAVTRALTWHNDDGEVLRISRETIRRGLQAGAGIVFDRAAENQGAALPDTKSDTIDPTTGADPLSVPIVSDFVFTQAPSTNFGLMSDDKIRQNLEAMIPARLIELVYDLAALADGEPVILPDPELPFEGGALLDAVLEGEPLEPSARSTAIEAARRQDIELSKRAAGYYRWAAKRLSAMLRDPHSTGMAPGWTNGPNFAALFLRAVYEASPHDLSRWETALLTGRRPQNVGSVVKRAGLQRQRQAAAEVDITPEKARSQACQAAKGRGRLEGVKAVIDIDKAEFRSVDAPDFDQWARANRDKPLKAVIKLKAKTSIAGDVRLSVRRPAAPAPADDPDGEAAPWRDAYRLPDKPSEPSAAPAAATPADDGNDPPLPKKPKRRQRSAAPGLSPTWRAAYRAELSRRLLESTNGDPLPGDVLADPIILAALADGAQAVLEPGRAQPVSERQMQLMPSAPPLPAPPQRATPTVDTLQVDTLAKVNVAPDVCDILAMGQAELWAAAPRPFARAAR